MKKTPKEKAQELIEKFREFVNSEIAGETDFVFSRKQQTANAKQCAIIAVNTTIAALEKFGYCGAMYDDFETGEITTTDETLPETYWQQVKAEIEKL